MNYHIIPNFKQEIAPPTLLGTMPFSTEWADYQWFNDLPKNTYYALWLRNPSSVNNKIDLPVGHDLYVITFHYEHLDCEWLMDQASKISQPIIVLNDGSSYDFPWPSHVHFYNFYSWHIHLDQIMSWFPHRQPRNLKYKVSAVCNRITQSKLILTTALLENLPPQELLIKLSTWLEEKNVHHRQPTGNAVLDQLSDIFFEKYYGQIIQMDDFTDATHNFQRVNSDPWQPMYLESALHFTNESYHYSYMNDKLGSYTRPGPLVSEKTFKCLLSGTPFISVSQFDLYGQLSQLGLVFDYGSIDLTWDNDPGNLSRLEGIVNIIRGLADYTKEDIASMARDSTDHNTEMIWSGEFQLRAHQNNASVRDQILKEYSR